MKNILSILAAAAVVFLFSLTPLAAEEKNAAAPAPAAPAAETKAEAPAPATEAPAAAKTEESSGGGIGKNIYNIGRGVVNVGTCWMEVFRCMLYRNAEAPFFGFIAGACEGAGFTVMRAFTGVTDILFLGFEPGNIFEPRFSEFVWESPWMPEKKLQFATPVLPQD